MMLTDEQTHRLRDLALAVTRGDGSRLTEDGWQVLDLRRPWSVQTSNSFRRIGTDRGDGDVLCAVTQRSDRQPDLHAPAGVLDYIVAAHPLVVLELLDRLDRTAAAIDHLRKNIVGYDEVFYAAAEIALVTR